MRAPVGVLLVLLLLMLTLSGCATQSALTAKATDCSRGQVDIKDSAFKQRGITTTWCAVCKNKSYLCVTNADRSRVECRPVRAEEVCR